VLHFDPQQNLVMQGSDLVESSQLEEEGISLREKLATLEENVKTLKSVMLAYI